MIHPPSFDEAELITLIDRLVRSAPGLHGGSAKVRQISQKQERYRGGYDAVVASVIPFYVQAKTASFHTGNSTKSDIISGRNSLGANCSPGAFAFYLRKHTGTTEPLQHNALYWLSLRSMAGYVSPTFVSEAALEKRMDEALKVQRHQIWRYDELGYHEDGISAVQKIKARHFRGLITIVPHRLVDSHLHRYSYTDGPNPEVVFHSDPEHVPNSYDFDRFIGKIILSEQSDRNNNNSKIGAPITVDELKQRHLDWIIDAQDLSGEGIDITLPDISNALASAGFSSSARFTRYDNAMSYLKKLDWLDLSSFFGALLKEKYGIRQLMVLNFTP